VALERVTVSRVGGLGLDLAEFECQCGNGGSCSLSDVIEGSNVANTGQFQSGDAPVSVAAVGDPDTLTEGVPTGMVLVDGLNFDATIGELGRFKDCPALAITVKRLTPR